ncbi:hypothetical protein TWF694_005698 [Orbilia ellipsospora]|uniref:GLEYA adhesin domain-containing protein n=1 Tax=Orbilia ellipsospora TaxID=2528407 RepID=A0AAV9WSN0_9PEZI
MGYSAAVYNISYTSAATTNNLAVYKTAVPYMTTHVPSSLIISWQVVATQVQLAYGEDLASLWLGEKAKSGWNRTNADLIIFWNSSPRWVHTTVNLVAGQYYPWRVFVENTSGAGGVELNVARGSNWQYSDISVIAPCNAFLGAPFPNFGSET